MQTTIELTRLAQVQQKLDEIKRRGLALPPLLNNMGEHMLNSTQDNFSDSQAPDGSTWAANSGVTLANYLGNKTGRKRKTAAANKKPLIGISGWRSGLAGTLTYQVLGDTLVFGSNKPYAAVMHFGAKKGAFGQTKYGVPIPWGDIPARPWLGVSHTDGQILLKMAGDYLLGS